MNIDNQITQKANELYEKRIAPYARNISVAQKKTIIDFQKLIFSLDHYGEQTEKIDPEILDLFWNKMEKFLDVLTVDRESQTKLLKDMKDYADIEASGRVGKKLSDYDLREFYFKKSCDVRIQRHLIRYLNQESPISSESEILRDTLEEIEDDVDDIEEDKSTPFNGNRLLEIMDSKDLSKLNEYFDLLNSLESLEPYLVKRIKEKLVNLSPNE